jgi:hypothetical protein
MHTEFKRIPELLLPILGYLEEIDRIKEEELWHREHHVAQEWARHARTRCLSGRDLLSNAISGGILGPHKDFPQSVRGIPVNVIPPYGRVGSCTEILLVFIGEADDFEIRILEAIEHCAARCRETTKYAIFYTMQWNDVTWKKHEDSFKLAGIIVVQKPFGRSPLRLL